MKVKVKVPFFDDNGIHKRGEVIETAMFNPFLMEEVEVKEAKEEKAVKAKKKV